MWPAREHAIMTYDVFCLVIERLGSVHVHYMNLPHERLAQVAGHIHNFEMPGLARKLLIFAAVDGLFLQPAGQRHSSIDASGIRLEYGSNKISPGSKKDDGADTGLEVHGIVGRSIHATQSSLLHAEQA